MPIALNRTTISAAGTPSAHFTSHIFDRVLQFGLSSADGRMSSASFRFPGNEMTLGFVRSTGHRIRLRENDDLTLLVPRAGRIEVEMAGIVHAARPGQILALRPGERTTAGHAAGSEGFDAVVVTLPMTRLALLMGETGQTGPMRRDALWLTGSDSRRLAEGLSDLATRFRRMPAPQLSDRSARRLSCIVAEMAASACLSAESPEPPPGQWRSDQDLVRNAIRLMHMGADGPLSLVDVARDLGIGPRRLQLAFQRAGESSPREMLARIRLDLARERLTRPVEAASVTDIAYDSGFLHLGRFSALYRRTYGELPSQTLARARSA